MLICLRLVYLSTHIEPDIVLDTARCRGHSSERDSPGAFFIHVLQSLNTDRAHLVPGAILTAHDMSSRPPSNLCKRCYYYAPHFSRQGSRGTERLSKPGKDHTAKDADPRNLAPEPVLATCYAELLCLCHLSPYAADRDHRAQTVKELTHDGEGTAGTDLEAEPWVCLSPTCPGVLPRRCRVFRGP